MIPVVDLNLIDPARVGILVYLRLEIEEQGKQQLLLGTDQLLVEAEALNFGKVGTSALWRNIVY